MLARWTLLFAAFALAAGLFLLGERGERASDSALEPRAAEGAASLRTRGFDAPEIAKPETVWREPVRPAEPEAAGAGEFDLLSHPELSGALRSREEVRPADVPLLPWQLDARHVITEQRLGVAITVQDPSGELADETHFMPATLSGEWRNRKILLQAEGYRPVVVANDSGKSGQVFLLCPIRWLQLEIRPPHEGDAACDVVLQVPGHRFWKSEIEAGEVTRESFPLGAQGELLLQVSTAGVVGARSCLLEETISLAPVGDTTYVLDLGGLPDRDLGSLRTVLRFQDRVYGADSWAASLHFADGQEGEGEPAEVARVRWPFMEQSSNGLQREWTLDRVASGKYQFRFEPLGIERDIEIRPGVGSDVFIEVPSLGTVDVGIRWAEEHQDRSTGYLKFGVHYRYPSKKSGGENWLSFYGMATGGAREHSPFVGSAEWVRETQNLYRISAPVGSELVLGSRPSPRRRIAEARTRVLPGIQRMELQAHPISSGAKVKQGR